MIRVIALTQFAFLTLGIVALRILIHSNSLNTTSAYLQQLNAWSLYLFALPLLWIGFATLSIAYGKTILPRIAQVIGVILAILCFLFLATVTFLT